MIFGSFDMSDENGLREEKLEYCARKHGEAAKSEPEHLYLS